MSCIGYNPRVDQFTLPPGERWRRYELQGLGLRDFAGARADVPLNPFALARFANLLVVNLHVPAYKVGGDGSRTILCRARYENPPASGTRWV